MGASWPFDQSVFLPISYPTTCHVRIAISPQIVYTAQESNHGTLSYFVRTLLEQLAGCEDLARTEWPDQTSAPRFRAQNISIPQMSTTGPLELRVMTWNIKYGAIESRFWFDCWGDRVQLLQSEIDSNMSANYDLIREVNPDILMVEEIELSSRRSQYYDMVQGILDNTELNYAAYYVTWDSRYVPSEALRSSQFGKRDIFKVSNFTRHTNRTKGSNDLDALTDKFYLRRAIGRAEIRIDDRLLSAYVVHTEAYDEDGTKADQIKQIHQLVSEQAGPFILGGDFNELPPNAVQLMNFPDERNQALCSDEFDQPPYTPRAMAPFFETMNPAISLRIMAQR